ncbi:MAG TPA: hypothetical protein V6D13_19280 [Halomicronema sp.]
MTRNVKIAEVFIAVAFKASSYFMVSRSVRLFSLTSVVPLVAGFSALMAVSVRAQLPSPPPLDIPVQAPPASNEPEIVRPMMLDGTLMSPEGGKRLMNDAEQAVGTQNYQLAATKLLEARQVFNQLSNTYQELAGSFTGLDNRISDSLRKKALETAQMRDEATYQLALVHRAQNKPELAVPLLVQIIRSQQPTRALGQKAYQQLFELGFVDSPFPRPRAGSGASPTPETSSQK